MKKEKPGYMASIPAYVRYDKKLCPNAKLLYGEISCLSNKHGYCFATNAYFADLYEVKKREVQRWLRELQEHGHIKIKITKHNDRRIYLADAPKIRSDDNQQIEELKRQLDATQQENAALKTKLERLRSQEKSQKPLENKHESKRGMSKKTRGGCQKRHGGVSKKTPPTINRSHNRSTTTTTSEHGDMSEAPSGGSGGIFEKILFSAFKPTAITKLCEQRNTVPAEVCKAYLYSLENKPTKHTPQGVKNPLLWMRKNNGVFSEDGEFLFNDVRVVPLLLWVDSIPKEKQAEFYDHLHAKVPGLHDDPGLWVSDGVVRILQSARKQYAQQGGGTNG